MAGTVKTVLLNPTPLVGRLTSASVVIPPGILKIRLTLNLLLADKLAVGLTADLISEISADGIVWRPLASFGWTSYGPGGYVGKPGQVNPDPSMGFNVPPEFVGQSLRVTLDLPQQLTVGATIEITT